MMLYRVEFVGVILDEGEVVTDRERIQAYVDKIMLELIKLNALNPRLSADPATGAVTVDVGVEEIEMFIASMAGFTQIRTAAHAAELGTPGWRVEWVKTTTVGELAQTQADALASVPA